MRRACNSNPLCGLIHGVLMGLLTKCRTNWLTLDRFLSFKGASTQTTKASRHISGDFAQANRPAQIVRCNSSKAASTFSLATAVFPWCISWATSRRSLFDLSSRRPGKSTSSPLRRFGAGAPVFETLWSRALNCPELLRGVRAEFADTPLMDATEPAAEATSSAKLTGSSAKRASSCWATGSATDVGE